MSSSVLYNNVFQAKIGNVQNQADTSAVYNGGIWSFKNSTALTSVTITDAGAVTLGPSGFTGGHVVNGSMGIGATPSASYKLDVASGYVRVARGISYNQSANVGIDLGAANADAVDSSQTYAWGTEIVGTASGQHLIFKRHRRADTSIEEVRIDRLGRLDLGPADNTNPTYRGKLRLWGGGRSADGGIEFVATNFQNGFGFRIVNPDDGSGTTPLVFQVRSNSTAWTANAFTLYNNGNYAFAGSNVSDERLKEDIHDVESQLQNVLALTPKTFRFKKQQQEDSSTQELGRVQHGFIAQEVKTIMPTLVTGAETNPDEYMGVDYMGLTSILVKAIQEQQAQIEALKAEVAALKAP